MRYQSGFTLLELLIALAVIAIVTSVTVTGIGDISSKKEIQNSWKELKIVLYNLKNEAMRRSRTTRIEVTQDGDNYFISTYVSTVHTKSCNNAMVANNILTDQPFNIPKSYTLNGNAMVTDICFYRDGSSTGGTFIFTPDNVADTSWILTITKSTGKINVDN
jgi:prepilin-type N-terminal cleavage/methylation domain-containing protein